VTVAWVVLSAAVVGLAIAAYSAIQTESLALINAAAQNETNGIASQNDFDG
jgi:hypothetical protein